MNHPFFEFFNKNRPDIDPNPDNWPSDWKTIKWKSYPRYPKIELPKAKLPDILLKEAIVKRRSERDFSKKPLSLKETSAILFYSCGLIKSNKNINDSRRAQPSGGGLYPLEIYVLIFNGCKELPEGAYHYNVLEHVLEKLPENNIKFLLSAFHYPWVTQASMVMVFSLIEERSRPKYGPLAYKVGLIEAGHMGQNIYLNCAAMNLKCCALGGLEADIIHQALDLDGINEAVFYAIAVGK